MAIDDETRATILRLHRVEHWSKGTIARHLGLHHSTVSRALGVVRPTAGTRQQRARLIDPFLPFLKDTLADLPDLPASVLYRMVCERGYGGGADHFRHLVATLRPKPKKEVFLRLQMLPGEQAQVDWAPWFGAVTVGRAKRRLMGFVMVLSYSRRIVLRCYFGATMCHFLDAHAAAFRELGGVPRSLLYDNARQVVLARRGHTVQYNPAILAFAAHYGFKPQATWPHRPNEKGRVERSIAYIRSSFLPGRPRRSLPLDELNAAAREWAAGTACARQWPEDRSVRVGDAFAREQRLLLALPATDFPCETIRPAVADKTAFVRFDRNDYSVPPGLAGRSLTLAESPDRIRILDHPGRVVAEHARSYDRQQRVEDPDHRRALHETRRNAAQGTRQRDRLLRTLPRSQHLLAAAMHRGEPVAATAKALLRLLDSHGAEELDTAMQRALARGSPHPNTVRLILEQRRLRRKLPPALPPPPDDDPRLADAPAPRRQHGLKPYQRRLDHTETDP